MAGFNIRLRVANANPIHWDEIFKLQKIIIYKMNICNYI